MQSNELQCPYCGQVLRSQAQKDAHILAAHRDKIRRYLQVLVSVVLVVAGLLCTACEPQSQDAQVQELQRNRDYWKELAERNGAVADAAIRDLNNCIGKLQAQGR